MREYFVMEYEAYAERRAILEVEGAKPLDAARDAADYAYATRFGVAATAAARGDWEPAREWCREERARFGEELARALMRDIQTAVKAEIKQKGG
jgi:hypothetical protein